MPLLEVEGLVVHYGPVRALDGVSLTVAPGEMVLVAGPNGAGKSTLLAAISGLVPGQGGRVLFDGHDLAGRRPYQIARSGLSHVPEGRGVLGELTVAENLRLATYAAGRLGRADRREQVLQLFPRLRERLEQPSGMLSGGEQQMLALGRGLLMAPKLLMIDELSLGLAPVITRELLGVLRRLAADGLAILIVEQSVREAARLADRAYVLSGGGLRFSGRANEILDERVWRTAYFGDAK